MHEDSDHHCAPDALKASAINTERAVTMNVKTRGEALLQPTRNKGTARHKVGLGARCNPKSRKSSNDQFGSYCREHMEGRTRSHRRVNYPKGATLHPAAQFIFGIPGGKIMPTLDVLNDEGPRLILVRDVLRRLR
jgi:hypothetical protein